MDSNFLAKIPLNQQTFKRIAWAVIVIGSSSSLWALWLGLHRKEDPANASYMQLWLVIGVGLYMIGRLILISIRMSEKKRNAATK